MRSRAIELKLEPTVAWAERGLAQMLLGTARQPCAAHQRVEAGDGGAQSAVERRISHPLFPHCCHYGTGDAVTIQKSSTSFSSGGQDILPGPPPMTMLGLIVKFLLSAVKLTVKSVRRILLSR